MEPGRLARIRRAAPASLRQPGDQHLKHSLISAPFFTLALAGSLAAQDVLSPLYGTVQPARTCESLAGMKLADADVDATVESATVESAGDAGPSYCRVTVAAGHPPAGDRITIWVALPLEGWNGRFLGTGGGGFSGGSPGPLPGAVREGFAAAATDTGHAGGSGGFALGAKAEGCGKITEADVAVIRAIWEGPRRRDGSFLWYGLTRGTNFLPLSGAAGDPLMGRPMTITLDWFRYFLARDPEFDWTGLTHADTFRACRPTTRSRPSSAGSKKASRPRRCTACAGMGMGRPPRRGRSAAIRWPRSTRVAAVPRRRRASSAGNRFWTDER